MVLSGELIVEFRILILVKRRSLTCQLSARVNCLSCNVSKQSYKWFLTRTFKVGILNFVCRTVVQIWDLPMIFKPYVQDHLVIPLSCFFGTQFLIVFNWEISAHALSALLDLYLSPKIGLGHLIPFNFLTILSLMSWLSVILYIWWSISSKLKLTMNLTNVLR